MSWNLDQAKIYLGIAPEDTSKDTQIQGVLDYTLSSVELLLQRNLPLAREHVVLHHVSTYKILLPRFPIANIHSIDGADPPSDLKIHHDVGWIEHASFYGAPEIDVDYEGGYAVFPEPLERALWEAFMSAWAGTDETTGGPPVGGGGGVVEGSGEVSSISLADFGTVRFDVGSTSTGGADSAASALKYWGWLAPWATVLGYYRSENGAELGMA